jgi:drug/metabolite transporter (DMT)-like permease
MSKLNRHSALFALVAAGLLWGLTVPLSKLSLEWLDGGWLTVVRFVLAAPLLALAGRRGLRAAATPRIMAAGAVGYGLVIVLQNAGIERTSVSHAALIVGAVPALVAVLSAVGGRALPRVAWIGFLLALAGVGIVAGGGGGGATLAGDGLVLASVLLSATFVVVQPRLLEGRDPIAVTAVQVTAGALAAVPNALAEGVPHAPASVAPVLALGALIVAGTLLPYALFAYGQSRVSAELAGAFLNLEPLVGAAAGALAFGDPFGPAQALGGIVILAGIALSTLGGASRTEAGEIPTVIDVQAPSTAARHRGKLHDHEHTRTARTRRRGPGQPEAAQAMTRIAPRPVRTAPPRAFSVPVVREIHPGDPGGGVIRTT